ncbi:MAG: hypothetical protein Q9174_005583 [Haloplaca sp. 1 TL-2023]
MPHVSSAGLGEKSSGRGGFGIVYLETESKGSVRAVKELPKYSRRAKTIDFLREVLAMAHFSKEEAYFVKLLGWYQGNAHIYIAMEYLAEGDLYARVSQPLPEAEVRSISYQLLEGLDFMHRKGFTHRDLKPSVGSPLLARGDAAERVERFRRDSRPSLGSDFIRALLPPLPNDRMTAHDALSHEWPQEPVLEVIRRRSLVVPERDANQTTTQDQQEFSKSIGNTPPDDRSEIGDRGIPEPKLAVNRDSSRTRSLSLPKIVSTGHQADPGTGFVPRVRVRRRSRRRHAVSPPDLDEIEPRLRRARSIIIDNEVKPRLRRYGFTINDNEDDYDSVVLTKPRRRYRDLVRDEVDARRSIWKNSTDLSNAERKIRPYTVIVEFSFFQNDKPAPFSIFSGRDSIFSARDIESKVPFLFAELAIEGETLSTMKIASWLSSHNLPISVARSSTLNIEVSITRDLGTSKVGSKTIYMTNVFDHFNSQFSRSHYHEEDEPQEYSVDPSVETPKSDPINMRLDIKIRSLPGAGLTPADTVSTCGRERLQFDQISPQQINKNVGNT